MFVVCAKLPFVYSLKSYGGRRGVAPFIRTSALDGDEWSASSPDRFTRREIMPGAN